MAEINDPLSTLGDPSGFPRLVTYELRPLQIVQTSNQVLMLYMFEKRYRVIWTDGRALPKNPDPRWYGYSVGRWEDDYTFVVETVGMDDRTWLDNSGDPHKPTCMWKSDIAASTRTRWSSLSSSQIRRSIRSRGGCETDCHCD